MTVQRLQKNIMKLAAACALAVTTTAQAAPLYSNAYIFGDSLSDTGNIKDSLGVLGGVLANSIGYGSNGRFSNGPVWHEYLTLNDDLVAQDNLGISRNGGTNYAYGGALVDGGSGLTGAVADSAVKQVSEYLGGSAADPGALYVSWIGGNDVRGLVGNSDPWDEVNDALDAMQDMLGDLLAAGATTLFVPNLPDIGSIPEFASNASDSQSGHDITVAWNDGLKNRLISLHDEYLTADIFYFDVFDLLAQLMDNPAAYGITDVTSECRSANLFGESACSAADTTLFWDYVHPTTAGHALLGEYAANALRSGFTVPLPSTLLLMLGALAAIARVRATRQR
ncbi:Phosphatidylcholine-sterol acyltransferase [Halioglobus japonicus]|nr:Phosphatidylcholine-sterol acyltransferase [Halioglobus japonicus]